MLVRSSLLLHVTFHQFKRGVYTDALKSIQNLYATRHDRLTNNDKSTRIQSALEIYQNVEHEAKTVSLCNSLLKLCFDFNDPHHALSIFDDLRALDSFDKQFLSYPLLIKTCIETNDLDKCMESLRWMKESKYTLKIHEKFISKLIQQCDSNLTHLRFIWAFIKNGNIQCKEDKFIKSSLIYRFGKCGQNPDALSVFHSISDSEKDMISILRILDSCNSNQYYLDTIRIYEDCLKVEILKNLQNVETSHNSEKPESPKNFEVTFHGHALTACSKLGELVDVSYYHKLLDIYNENECVYRSDNIGPHLSAIKAATNIHDVQKAQNIIQSVEHKFSGDIRWNNAMINFYGKSENTQKAMEIFRGISPSERSDVTIGTIMAVLIESERFKGALKIYGELDATNYIVDILAMRASIHCGEFESAQYIEESLISQYGDNMEVMTRIIDLYSSLTPPDITGAQRIFDYVTNSKSDMKLDGNCIAAMMKCHMALEQWSNALDIYEKFSDSQISNKSNNLTNDFCHMLAIKICTKSGDFERGQQIHERIKIYDDDIQLKNTLIDFYGNSYNLTKSKEIFDSIVPEKRTIVTINAMMEAYCINGLYSECVELYKALQRDCLSLKSDMITFAILFEACSNESAYHFGQEIHRKLKDGRTNILNDSVVQCNLINMYGKCGILEECWNVFNEIKEPGIGVYNAMIHAHGRNGDMNGVRTLMERIRNTDGLVSDVKTYVVLMNACSHSGDVEEAKRLWNEEVEEGMKSDLYLMTAFVDCLTRKGEVSLAKDIIVKYEKEENVEGNKVMYMSLLTGCHKHENIELAQDVFEEIEKRFRNDTEFVDDARMVLLHRTMQSKMD